MSAEMVFGPFELEELSGHSGEKRWAVVSFVCRGETRNALMASIHVPPEIARKLELFGGYEIVLRPIRSEP